MQKKSELFIALIGAITGIIALGWQVWDSVKPIEDKIIADYEISRFGNYELWVSITNIGDSDVYLSSVDFDYYNPASDGGRSGGSFPVSPMISENVLKPGQNIKYKLYSFDEEKYFETLINFREYAQIKITTTRGKEIILTDLYQRMFQYIDDVDSSSFTSESSCECGGIDLDCSDFSSQLDAETCYLKCLNQVGHDVHKLDPDGDGVACE